MPFAWNWRWRLAARRALADEPRLNQIQVIGSHNSYHIAPYKTVLELIAATGRRRAESLEYTHPPLAEQFSRQGIRQVELDVYADPKGGLFAAPSARKILVAMGKEAGPDPNANGQLKKPGLKILHVPDVDFRSTAPTFVDALTQIRAWSQANRSHVPILILVELKDDAIPGLPTRPVHFGRDEIETVDAEIVSVFAKTDILTPDRVRGQFATLPEAVRAQGWPLVNDVRGLVMFALDNEGAVRDRYLEGHAALKDRAMFVTVAPEHPAAAWFKVNDPVKDFDKIRRLVKDGFLVRTRADADTRQARTGDVTQRDKAMASGAQFISTDYREPDRRFSDYSVRFPGGQVARCNPVSGDPAWSQIDLERGAPGSGQARSKSRAMSAPWPQGLRVSCWGELSRPRDTSHRGAWPDGFLVPTRWRLFHVQGAIPCGEAATVSSECPIGGDDAVAGNHDAYRVPAIRRPNRSRCPRTPDPPRELRVAHGLSVGNRRKPVPDQALKRSAGRPQR